MLINAMEKALKKRKEGSHINKIYKCKQPWLIDLQKESTIVINEMIEYQQAYIDTHFLGNRKRINTLLTDAQR